MSKKPKKIRVEKGGIEIITQKTEEEPESMDEWRKRQFERIHEVAPSVKDSVIDIAGRIQSTRDKYTGTEPYILTRPFKCEECHVVHNVGDRVLKVGYSLVCPIDGGLLERHEY